MRDPGFGATGEAGDNRSLGGLGACAAKGPCQGPGDSRGISAAEERRVVWLYVGARSRPGGEGSSGLEPLRMMRWSMEPDAPSIFTFF